MPAMTIHKLFINDAYSGIVTAYSTPGPAKQLAPTLPMKQHMTSSNIIIEYQPYEQGRHLDETRKIETPRLRHTLSSTGELSLYVKQRA